MALTYTITAASGTLTGSGVFANGETVVVGGKTYTFKDTLTNTDGFVHVGSDLEGSIKNLAAAINLSNAGESAVGAGTDYAAATTENAEVESTAITATTMVVTAKTPGSVGNLIASTETGSNAAWGAATLENGAGHTQGWVDNMIALNQINAEVAAEMLKLTPTAD